MTTTMTSPVAQLDTEEQSSESISEQDLLRGWFSREHLRWNNTDWVVTGFLIFVHVGALAAPFFFSWGGLATAVVLHWLTCSLGVCFGYHRYLSHRTLKMSGPAEFFVLLCGALSGEGSPLTWAAVHRLHHQKSDLDGDPHSPNQGEWWSHIMWLFPRWAEGKKALLFRRYIPELVDRPMLQFFEKTYGWILLASGLILVGAGYATGGAYGAASLLLWGVCLRMTLAYHSTWFVNSATHLWGYRNYETRDRSRNLWWVAVFAYGEGWHNNHHAHPSVAPAGHRWWELDPTWWAIKTFRFLGLVHDVNDRIPAVGSKAE